MKIRKLFVLLAVFSVSISNIQAEIITLSTAFASLAALGAYVITRPSIYSFYDECCHYRWVNTSISSRDIETYLEKHLVGQHLVTQIVPRLVHTHISKRQPNRPLVLSFHGPAGVGKNFVTTLLAELMYKKGTQSKFFHLFATRWHFKHASKVEEYKMQLHNWISANVSLCPRSIFVFDEAGDMPTGLIDSLKPFLDSYEQLDGIDYRRAIFVFLSNSGSERINQFTMNHLLSGRARSEIALSEVERQLMDAVYNEDGGFLHTALIDHQLVTAFLPFLPLSHDHVRHCIERYVKENYAVADMDAVVTEVLAQIDFVPDSNPLFSAAGCRRVHDVADRVIERDSLRAL